MIEQFAKHQFLNLETFKKNGAGVKTPLWFVVDQGVLYMRTPLNSWKVKRIRNNAQVRVVPSDASGDPKGTWITGQAEVYAEQEMAWVNDLVIQKYGLMKRMMDLMNRVRGRTGKFAVLVVRVGEEFDIL